MWGAGGRHGRAEQRAPPGRRARAPASWRVPIGGPARRPPPLPRPAAGGRAPSPGGRAGGGVDGHAAAQKNRRGAPF
eukprot:927929-Prorocentrum_minimum.AAC.2